MPLTPAENNKLEELIRKNNIHKKQQERIRQIAEMPNGGQSFEDMKAEVKCSEAF